MVLLTRITITSAVPYVNGVKHLGNIVGSLLPADVYHRLLGIAGVENIFICGTDDHGTAVELEARSEGTKNEEIVKKYHRIQEEIYKRWNFDFTFFGNTSSRTNHEMTQSIFNAAYRNNYIIHKTLVVPFCETDKRHLPDRYINGTCPHCSYQYARGDQCEQCGNVLDPIELEEPRCSVCGGNKITFKEEKHLFLDYSLLTEKLHKWIEERDWPYNTKAASLGWVHGGLKPRCITRNLEWGVRVPLEGFEHLVFYVWFDAPIGYISITKDAFEAGRIKRWKEYWTDSKIYHFLGKDNVPFHTIFWPGTLMAARGTEIDGDETNFLLPDKVIGYDYLNWEGQKFSTSKGIGLFSDEALDLFPTDYWRFYLSYILPENKDSNFDWDDFEKRINNELIANYGNLFYRVTHFIREHFDGRVPKGHLDKEMEQKLRDTAARVEKDIGKVRLREILKHTLALAAETNKYFQEREPWKKYDQDAYGVSNTIFTSVNLLRAISVLLYPFMPETAEKALKALGHTEKKLANVAEAILRTGDPVSAVLLFKKIERDEIDRAKQYVSKYAKGKTEQRKKIQKTEHAPADSDTLNLVNDVLPIKEFQKVELVVGTIVSVDEHPNAEKLFVLQVDLGKEIRQLVAGLRNIYSKYELKNRQVIVVTNLEPKELRGVKSHGMILAAEDGTIVEPEKETKNGARIM